MLIKRKIYYVSIIIILLMIFGNRSIKSLYAFSKSEHSYHVSDAIDVRIVEIDDKSFYVYTNQEENFILVEGMVNDWHEMKRIEEYFNKRAPSTYAIKYDIYISQKEDNE
ncbi:MAG: hypothetical protein ACMUIP_12925 [bacterium]